MKKLITLSLLAIAVSMTASIVTPDEKPCCKKPQPCCKDKQPCCSDADTLDVPLHMETNGNPQLL